MNEIETAKLIISQDGSCDDAPCENCPAEKVRQKLDLYSCNDIWDGDKDKYCKKWFKNWLKENDKENKMSDKIQMTEEQAREYDKKRRAFTCETCGKTPCKSGEEDCDYQFLKNNGYILKSELQQKVERVEASLKEYIDGHSVDILDTFKASIDVIQLLKQSHPEFKEK